MSTGIGPFAVLKAQLAAIKTPEQALDLAQRAARMRRTYEAIGASVEECNRYAELYLGAYWKFGQLVKGIPHGRPDKRLIDEPFPGTKKQRHYARQLQGALTETEIAQYVRTATEQLESASIAGCLEWVDPGRHGNLKGEYEWYTPKPILDAARQVMGGIDLDPASCEEAQEDVQAATYFTEEQDGLKREWAGRVFLNPPFAHPAVKHFADKLLASFEAGTVPQAVFLSNACTDTAWWQKPRREAYPDTGIDLHHAKGYHKMTSRHHLPLFLAFVDDQERRIYGNWWSRLLVPSKPGLTSRCGGCQTYPWIHGKQIYFPLDRMLSIAILDEGHCVAIRQYRTTGWQDQAEVNCTNGLPLIEPVRKTIFDNRPACECEDLFLEQPNIWLPFGDNR